MSNFDFILKDKPFGMEIKEIKSLSGDGALSGQSFVVINNEGVKFKLRACSDVEHAKRIETNVKLLPHAFPKFFGRDRNYVLFEWVDGELWYDALGKPIPDSIFYQLGKIIGEAHELNDVKPGKSADGFFSALLRDIKDSGKVSSEFIKAISDKYSKLRKGLKVDVVLEINDIHPRNFIISDLDKPERAKLYFVDEDGFGHKIKGLGMAKPLFIEKIVKKESQLKAFWNGYKEHHSNDYFDKDYQNFVTFVQLVRSLAVKCRKNLDTSKIISSIKEFL